MPGEGKTVSCSLKPVGSRLATKDYIVAVECAKQLLAKTIYQSETKESEQVENIAELVKEYLIYVDSYHRDHTGAKTKETREIRYTMNKILLAGGQIIVTYFAITELQA